jgi:glycosyltransferase involved in cell wall biosynthesis
MLNGKLFPNYILEASWEVCNKVGGIYTVLSTRAKILQEQLKDHVLFIGPDFGEECENPLFNESKSLLSKWKKQACAEGLAVRVGRWLVPGKPIAILVDFKPFYARKNEIYGKAWQDFGLDSLHAYGDYDEASMFSFAAGKVVESFYRFQVGKKEKVVFQAHEWMTGLGALYVRKYCPQVATIFTTHATSIGRSIAGNNKPLYDYLFAYNGDQMARELNMEAKHYVEKVTAHNVDCFTTVSEVTARECRELLNVDVQEILMNGFDMSFVPEGNAFPKARNVARERLLRIANCVTGCAFEDKETVLVGISGRYEFKNKGIDVFLEALNRLSQSNHMNKQVLAFIMVPAWVGNVRKDLAERLVTDHVYDSPLPSPIFTHDLFNWNDDCVISTMKAFGMWNEKNKNVKVLFVPCYLDGRDNGVNLHYYDTLIGMDLTAYPSYYEPWGYTPTESVAFHVPCITTDLAGFGQWVNSMKGGEGTLQDGVKVIHRTDYNYSDVANAIRNTIEEFANLSDEAVADIRDKAFAIAEKAQWSNFIEYYYNAYDIALRAAAERNKK